MAVKPIPDGYHSVTPYLTVQGAARLLEFLTRAFDATVTEHLKQPDGTVGHAEVRIGDRLRVRLSEGQIAAIVGDRLATRRRRQAPGSASDDGETQFGSLGPLFQEDE